MSYFPRKLYATVRPVSSFSEIPELRFRQVTRRLRYVNSRRHLRFERSPALEARKRSITWRSSSARRSTGDRNIYDICPQHVPVLRHLAGREVHWWPPERVDVMSRGARRGGSTRAGGHGQDFTDSHPVPRQKHRPADNRLIAFTRRVSPLPLR